MKPRESTIQAKEFQAAALRRQLAQFERMIGDLEVIRAELGKQVDAEESRTGIDDPANYAYSTVARAARERRSNLTNTLDDLNERRSAALEALDDINGFFAALNGASEMAIESSVLRKPHSVAA